MTKDEMIAQFNEFILHCNQILMQSKLLADQYPEYENMSDRLIDIVSSLVGGIWAHCLYDQPVVFVSVESDIPSLKVNTASVIEKHGIPKTAEFFKKLLTIDNQAERQEILKQIQG